MIEGLRRADDRACMEFYKRFGSQILAIAARILGNRQDAQDVLQETALKVLNAVRSPAYDPDPKAFQAYVRRIAANTSLSALRKRATMGEMGVDDLPLSHPSPSPEKTVLENEQLNRIELQAYKCWKGLSTYDRLLITLVHFEQRPETDIAASCVTAFLFAVSDNRFPRDLIKMQDDESNALRVATSRARTKLKDCLTG